MLNLHAEIRRLFNSRNALFSAALFGRYLCRNKRRNVLLYPLDHPRTRYTFSAAGAIFQAIKSLNLSSEDVVLCPSYNCGHEVDPILKSAVGVRYYAVDRQMRIDVENLKNKIDDDVKAILVTHYFGFPQSIEEISVICREFGIHLIEDCAHALFSKQDGGALGSFGDIAVFSLRKSLPIPNGGAITVNNPSIRTPQALDPPPIVVTWAKIFDRWRKSLLVGVRGPLRLFVSRATLCLMLPLAVIKKAIQLYVGKYKYFYDPDYDDFDYDPEVLNWGISAESMRIIGNNDISEIIRVRRRNYEFLLASLQGIKGARIVYPVLPSDVCPLYFPLIWEGSRDVVFQLYNQGMSVAFWWSSFHPDVPWNNYEDAVYLKKHILCVPVHQDLDPAILLDIAEALRSASLTN